MVALNRFALVSTSLLLALLVAAIGSGCVPSSPIRIVREIPDAKGVVVRPGGGALAYVVQDAAYIEQAFTLTSWDATPALPVGRPTKSGMSVSATRSGLYVSFYQRVAYSPWAGSLESTLPALARAYVSSSPSGARLVADWGRLPSNTGRDPWPVIVDRSRKDKSRVWQTTPNFGGGLAWLSDSQFLFDTEPYGSVGPISVATLRPDGRVSIKKTGLTGYCPAPSPDGAFWAYSDRRYRLVIYDVAAKREVASWDAPMKHGDVGRSVAWADSTHVLFADRPDGTPRLWVLDVSGAVHSR